jgi:hypothetical protein
VQKYFAQDVPQMLINDLNRSKSSESATSDSRCVVSPVRNFCTRAPDDWVLRRRFLPNDIAHEIFSGTLAAVTKR